MYLIMDFIPNHTSNKHEWFIKSSENDNPDNPYRDYYVWHTSTNSKVPPNNWVQFKNKFLKFLFYKLYYYRCQ